MSEPRKGLMQRLKDRPRELFVRGACYLSIVAMLTMIWSVLDPRPVAVMLAMTAGQGLSALAFVMFLIAVLIPHAGARDEPG